MTYSEELSLTVKKKLAMAAYKELQQVGLANTLITKFSKDSPGIEFVCDVLVSLRYVPDFRIISFIFVLFN